MPPFWDEHLARNWGGEHLARNWRRPARCARRIRVAKTGLTCFRTTPTGSRPQARLPRYLLLFGSGKFVKKRGQTLYYNMREWNAGQDIEVGIIRDNTLGTRYDGAVNKLVVVWIGNDQPETETRINP